MASSPLDPQSAHSLWLQRRSSRRAASPQWRSDWTPLALFLLLLGLLILLSVFLPSQEAVEKVKQAAGGEQRASHLSVVGVLTEP
jgi:ferric-dicitrate binding protein FerR (iron transport regulator)